MASDRRRAHVVVIHLPRDALDNCADSGCTPFPVIACSAAARLGVVLAYPTHRPRVLDGKALRDAELREATVLAKWHATCADDRPAVMVPLAIVTRVGKTVDATDGTNEHAADDGVPCTVDTRLYAAAHSVLRHLNLAALSVEASARGSNYCASGATLVVDAWRASGTDELRARGGQLESIQGGSATVRQ
jgi:hypothetical protein